MKESMKKILISAIKSPMMAILKITESKDSDKNKVRAVNLYCRFIIKTINQTVDKYLNS